MNLEQIMSYMLSLHVILLGVKLYAAYVIIGLLTITKTPSSKSMFIFKISELFLLIFTLIFIVIQFYFVYAFFQDILAVLHYYEYLAIIDQILFTVIAITYMKKERKNV